MDLISEGIRGSSIAVAWYWAHGQKGYRETIDIIRLLDGQMVNIGEQKMEF